MPTVEEYDAAFLKERENAYPMLLAIEDSFGFRIDRDRIEKAARTLACPVKVNPPNWQHGRVIYAAARAYLEKAEVPVFMLDIGTAKGFSALCMAWALADSGKAGQILSIDVIDPEAKVARNSVEDLYGLRTVREFVSQWPETHAIEFLQSTGVDWLKRRGARIHFAFVDGKHSFDAVRQESLLIANRQEAGDVMIFDDLQIDGIATAVAQLQGYDKQFAMAKPERRYAIAIKC